MLPDMPYISTRLSILMKREGLSIKQLSASSGVAERTIIALTKGRQISMKINVAAMLCRELDVLIKDFIDYMCIEDFPIPLSIRQICEQHRRIKLKSV